MNIKHIFLVFALLVTCLLSSAQNISTTNYETSPKFSKAYELFQHQNFTAAMHIFEELYSENTSSTYFEKSNTLFCLATCNKLVGDSYLAEIYFNKFLQDFPESIHNNEALFALGQIQFANKSYKTSLETFNKIDISKLSNDLIDEYYFKKGYCYLKSNKAEEAKSAFYQAVGSDSPFGYAATYYYACINYDEKNYKSALSNFNRVLNNDDYKQPALQYIIRIYSVLGQFKEITDLYHDNFISGSKKDNIETTKIFANAFFQTENYSVAAKLYEDIVKNLDPDDDYQLAYCYFINNEFDKAIPFFENAAVNKDSIGQNALYHVGLCNIKTDNKNFAATAFKDAYKINADKQISEKALFNYVKIIYETGFDPYSEAVTTLQEYINNNPKSNRISEAYSYLAKLFISTNNYQKALEAIDKLDVKTPELKSAYQNINYSGGIDKFNNKKYSDAASLLKQSQKYPQDQLINADASYWIGECYYRQEKFSDAIAAFNSFINNKSANKSSNYNNAYYSLGYCYFKTKNYASAEKSFTSFTNSAHNASQMTFDAYNRIGDCNFIRHKYSSAIDAYDKALKINGKNSDYSLYYKALALGAQNKLSDKSTTLLKIIDMPYHTILRGNAMFELGNTYSLNNQPSKAIESYKDLINEYPKNRLAIAAKQKIGMLYYNENDNENAIANLKDVVIKYPRTKEAGECLAILKNIYVEENKVDEYLDFVNNTAHISTTTSEADSLSFSSAQKLFMSEKYSKAKDAFLSYLKKFPLGSYIAEANYYIGECLFIENNYDDALNYYTTVYESKSSMYTEDAKLKAAKILLYNDDYNTSSKLFKEIINEAEYDFIINEANVDLMRCYYKMPDYEELGTISKTVMNNRTNAPEIILEARFNYAYSLFGLGNFDNAFTEFNIIAAEKSGVICAEAKYYCANIKYIQSNFEKAESLTFELINDYSSYDYWVAKGFILLADIYTKTDNIFQARQTLQSIIENYQGEDLKQEAQSKLDKLNQNE